MGARRDGGRGGRRASGTVDLRGESVRPPTHPPSLPPSLRPSMCGRWASSSSSSSVAVSPSTTTPPRSPSNPWRRNSSSVFPLGPVSPPSLPPSLPPSSFPCRRSSFLPSLACSVSLPPFLPSDLSSFFLFGLLRAISSDEMGPRPHQERATIFSLMPIYHINI